MVGPPASELLLRCPDPCFSQTDTESRSQTAGPTPPGGGGMTPSFSGAGEVMGLTYKRTTDILSKAVEVTAPGKGAR